MNEKIPTNNKSSKNVAIVYQYLAHYRITIARTLCLQNTNEYPTYTWISGITQNTGPNALKTIDPKWGTKPQSEGGFRWRIIKNIWLYKTILWQRGLLGIAFRKEFDCIIYLGDMHYLSTWVGCMVSRIRGKRVLMWSHGFYGSESKIKFKLRKLFFSLADGILLYGCHARNIMIENGIQSEKLYVVYNSLDYESQLEHRENTSTQEIEATSARLFKDPTLPVIIFTGRIIRSKGLALLLESICTVRARGTLINVLFVGDGPDRMVLENQASQLGLDGIATFYGECYSEKELAVLFGLSDICVSPEGVGLTAMHAMAYGVPVITHDEPAKQKPEFEAIFPNKTGDFFKKGDPDSLANNILNWITKVKTDNTISSNCIQVIENLYHTDNQTKVINLAVHGHNANEVLDAFGPKSLDFT